MTASLGVAVSAFTLWTPEGVWPGTAPGPRDRSASATTSPTRLGTWPEAPPLSQLHPRARRPHPHAVQLVQLASDVFRQRALNAAGAEPLVPSQVEWLLGTRSGSEVADQDFLSSMAQRGLALGSPSLFVYTLPTAAPAEVTLALGLRGGLRTVSAGAVSGLWALAHAASHIAAGRSRACLCGVSEQWSPESHRKELLALFLLERADEASPHPRLIRWETGYEPPPSSSSPSAEDDAATPLVELARALHRESGSEGSVAGSSPEGHWARLWLTHPRRGW